jgi:4-hydroxythreonine-4-phosphate dehydrogenase
VREALSVGACAALYSAEDRDALGAGAVVGTLAEVVRSLSEEELFDALVLTGGGYGGRGGAAAGRGGSSARGGGGAGHPGGDAHRAETLPGRHQGWGLRRTGYTGKGRGDALGRVGRVERAMDAPLIAVTMGDPAGIGPEIVARTFADPGFGDEGGALVVGDSAMLERAVRLLGLPLGVNAIHEPEEAGFEPGAVDVLAVGELPDDLPFGELDARAGDAAFRYVEKATELASAGGVGAIATAPLNKEAMHLAGHRYPGHTEILANLTGTEDYAMMLVTDELRVIHISTHVSLREAIERVRPERELAVIRLAHGSMQKLGVEEPKVAVAGLNPHAGENALFGTEDAERIAPAIEEAREEGIEASGPYPPDTVLMRARRGAFDIVVVQYHDQGHIPVKLMGFDTGVNVTVGLPFFRTSVDHGTAFDTAGTGEADHASMRAAINLARRLAGAEAEERAEERS